MWLARTQMQYDKFVYTPAALIGSAVGRGLLSQTSEQDSLYLDLPLLWLVTTLTCHYFGFGQLAF